MGERNKGKLEKVKGKMCERKLKVNEQKSWKEDGRRKSNKEGERNKMKRKKVKPKAR